MYNITLISSKHVEVGKCNSKTLYEIIKSINPEVIFEELPQSYFDLYYGDNATKFTLETIAITDLLKSKKIKQVLVDNSDFPFLEALKNNYSIVIDHCMNIPRQNTYPIKEAILKSNELLSEQGFDYLNSIKSEIYQANLKSLINECLIYLNSKKYFETLKHWDSLTEFRENHMLKSIYKYSEENQYKDGVFTLGVAHRKSIKEKIKEFQQRSDIKLNWKFYGE